MTYKTGVLTITIDFTALPDVQRKLAELYNALLSQPVSENAKESGNMVVTQIKDEMNINGERQG